VLIGHYLGADHAGHTHGVRSPQMAAKLAQMDAQVATVIGAGAW
jgi:predicted AlkP superfamily pyrophosphatase or phosphodiesterase